MSHSPEDDNFLDLSPLFTTSFLLADESRAVLIANPEPIPPTIRNFPIPKSPVVEDPHCLGVIKGKRTGKEQVMRAL